MSHKSRKFDPDQVRNDFLDVVNMSASELDDWLSTEESLKVGWKGADGQASESVGHASGRKIVEILRKAADEFSPEDYAQMKRVIAFVRRHSAQRPENIYTSRWRYSLMNWGHDPLKEIDR